MLASMLMPQNSQSSKVTSLRVNNIDFVDDFKYLVGSYIATTANDVKKRQGQEWDAFWS